MAARAKIDPELKRRLAAGAPGSEPVEVVLRLRSPNPRKSLAAAPNATRAMAESLVTRVTQDLGAAAGKVDYNVFPNLGYFVVSAPKAFVERMVAQPEIASAASNRRRA